MRNIILACLVISMLSCSRGYYNNVQTYYDYEEAYDLVQGLKEGILIVQIPCYRRKTAFLKSLYKNQKDPDKKQKLKNEYDNFLIETLQIQSWLIEATNKQYQYSNYAFVPDTLISEFKNGKRENIFLKDNLTLGAKIDIDTSKTIMLMREFRHFSHLHIHKIDGSYPPDPFPYASTLPTGSMGSLSLDELMTSDANASLHNAILILNNRLARFTNIRRAPN